MKPADLLVEVQKEIDSRQRNKHAARCNHVTIIGLQAKSRLLHQLVHRGNKELTADELQSLKP